MITWNLECSYSGFLQEGTQILWHPWNVPQLLHIFNHWMQSFEGSISAVQQEVMQRHRRDLCRSILANNPGYHPESSLATIANPCSSPGSKLLFHLFIGFVFDSFEMRNKSSCASSSPSLIFYQYMMVIRECLIWTYWTWIELRGAHNCWNMVNILVICYGADSRRIDRQGTYCLCLMCAPLNASIDVCSAFHQLTWAVNKSGPGPFETELDWTIA